MDRTRKIVTSTSIYEKKIFEFDNFLTAARQYWQGDAQLAAQLAPLIGSARCTARKLCWHNSEARRVSLLNIALELCQNSPLHGVEFWGAFLWSALCCGLLGFWRFYALPRHFDFKSRAESNMFTTRDGELGWRRPVRNRPDISATVFLMLLFSMK
jgi:hypothetical protein